MGTPPDELHRRSYNDSAQSSVSMIEEPTEIQQPIVESESAAGVSPIHAGQTGNAQATNPNKRPIDAGDSPVRKCPSVNIPPMLIVHSLTPSSVN